MPFYLARKTVADRTLRALADHAVYPSERSGILVFNNPASAHAENKNRADWNVRFFQTYDERCVWHQRENGRFRSDVYLAPPWRSIEPFELRRSHFAHVAINSPGMIAYTESDERGHLDRQTVTRPGRYLERFYPGLTAEQREVYIGQCHADKFQLQIATSPADISRIYMSSDVGFTSCMQWKESAEYDWQTDMEEENGRVPCHPCAVYGDSDLAVAYLGDLDRIRARAVVWPEKKRWARIYGQEGALQTLLERAGYSDGSLSGACVRLVTNDNGTVVLPYIDGISHARVDRTRTGFVRLGEGPLSASNTSGLGEDEDRRDLNSCDRCGCEYDPEDEGDGSYCQSCLDDQTSCAECDATIWPDDRHTHETNNGYVCRHCYPSVHHECERNYREAHNLEDLCVDCAKDVQVCTECRERFDIDETVCPHCDHAVRCTRTADLPLDNPPAVDGLCCVSVRDGWLTADGQRITIYPAGEPCTVGTFYTLVRIDTGPIGQGKRLIRCQMPEPRDRHSTVNAESNGDTLIGYVALQCEQLQALYPQNVYQIVKSSEPLPDVVERWNA